MSILVRFKHWLRLPISEASASASSIGIPRRAELFSAEQMEEHGIALATSHEVERGIRKNNLLQRLDQNEQTLLAARSLLADTIRERRRVTPASEWLLDNYYLIEENLRTARRHFPRGYSFQLPRLARGISNGLPRIYDVALNAISHGDGRFDQESLNRFVAAYQLTKPLSLGELWAIPIMLRLALIENLCEVAGRIALDRRHRDLAAVWGDRMAQVVARDPKSLILVVADMARADPPVSSSFVSELMQRLQGQSASLALPVSWLEQRLSEAGVTIQQLVHSENQQQAADQMSVSNAIGSLRLLNSIDWRGFVESLSGTEKILSSDPRDVYSQMDFATRDRYRHVIERLARRAERSEEEVAALAIELACAAASEDASSRKAHVGYHLVDEGRSALEQRLGLRMAPRDMPLHVYVGITALLTAAFTFGPAWLLWRERETEALLVLTVVLLMIASSQLALIVTNWLAAITTDPRALPRMDYSNGLPSDAITAVVVPTLLGGKAAAQEQIDELEVRYLANRDENLRFVLLGDFADAESETLEVDVAILAVASAAIARLNTLYALPGTSVFFLLHRARRWNQSEGVWMGEERKRGKLGDLNALILTGDESRFLHIVGDVGALRSVRYVITLDADTQLPRDAAHELVATMQHPLNRAHFDESLGRVTAGYGILQPRVGISLPLLGASRYARLFSGDPGVDPYTRAVSDVYQDLFGEGSFTGKGIYDVEIFERSLAGRLPTNRILSHDLIEGCYARSGLASDLTLFENFPQRYFSEMRRRHRWMRGDWQIARWLWPTVPRDDGSTTRNSLSALSRWKIFDNLRRSLVAPSFFVLLVLGWTMLSPSIYWMALLLQLIFVPVVVEALFAVVRKPSETTWQQHTSFAMRGASRVLAQALFGLACLPYEALVAFDAIVRTLWRQLVSHRLLLEWTPSSEIERREDPGIPGLIKRMAFGPIAALVTLAAILYWQPSSLWIALPILTLWLLSPVIAWYASGSEKSVVAQLDPVSEPLLREVARRTWYYFDRHVVASENWLPPDNYQETPGDVIAHRTSPTNIGLALLANLTAYDFGYVSLRSLIERCEATFDTLSRLQRYHGHFFNWYDTQTLEPLAPRYVSVVDSGNLAGHLLTLRQGLLTLHNEPLNAKRVFTGLLDTARIAEGIAPQLHKRAIAEFIELANVADQRDPAIARTAAQDLQVLTAKAKTLCDEMALPDEAWRSWIERLVVQCEDLLEEVEALDPSLENPPPGSSALVENWKARLHVLAETASAFTDLDYEFLYDRDRDLFHIGFNVDDHRCDAGYYDLLASEVRLGIFVAIAQGKVPQKAWYSLGRLMIQDGARPVLLSWSGSMFEYLMPNLVMPTYPSSLLGSTSEAAISRQIGYGAERGVPWGISECGFLLTDSSQNYQYRAFGVPGLGLLRGLSQELVVAPYASVLALLAAPNEAAANMQRMADLGWLSEYGFYEAVDYTPTRLPPGEKCGIVRSYMAHHQGMSLLAIAHVLLDRPMQRRFQSDPYVQSALLLLQERVPRASGRAASNPELVDVRNESESPSVPLRVFNRPDPQSPAIQLLSNGRYHVMVTSAGGGYSHWGKFALTRWQEDPTRDCWGSFCYLRDVGSGSVWSTAFQPTLQADDAYEAIFTESRAEYRRRFESWEAHTDIVVSPEDDIELRRTRITNRSDKAREIEFTSYAEIVLASEISDNLHPAFSKLFLQTEILASRHSIICTRRPRSDSESTPSLFHLLAVHEGTKLQTSYETDRARFIGRGRTVANPIALEQSTPLGGAEGSVLDPIVAIRHRILVEPGQTAIVDFVIGVARDREHCIQLSEKYHDRRLADRVIDLAWTHSRVSLRQINISEAQAQTYARLAGCMLYSDASQRAHVELLIRNRRSQAALWAYAISGDLPIMLVQISGSEGLGLARDAVQAHAYWRMKGLAADLVIWNEERGGYRQALQDALVGMIAASIDSAMLERPGGIFLRLAEQVPHEDRLLLLSVSRIVLSDKIGSIIEHLHRRVVGPGSIPLLVPTDTSALEPPAPAPSPVPESRGLRLYNGIGGFSSDGREYVIITSSQARTPLPWINVLSNPIFGCIVSESGLGYTWRENAHEYRLTPWSNDPVSDTAGEAIYLRDEQSGRYWSTTPLPVSGTGPWKTRHGFGYSIFEHIEDGIQSEQQIYVSPDSAVKYFVLRLRNSSGRDRSLSATGYVEWALGSLSAKSAMHTVTELDPRSGALFARSSYHTEFGEWVSFLDVDEPKRTLTGDRLEFIGRNGNLAKPAAMRNARLSGRVGAGADPCGAIQIPFELKDGESRRLIFRLGAAHNEVEASALVKRFRQAGSAKAAFDATRDQWSRLLGAIELETPDESVNLLANGWLLYQVIACRLWGRSGFYQSGGAFGFRDQLQDSMALVHAAPEMLRNQLLLCASRQFKEGDVQHWWHPPSGRGVRTRCSDDFLWLPLAMCRYLNCTADLGVLDEPAPFLDGRLLNDDEESYYDLPLRLEVPETLYTHCVLAIRRGLNMGVHGLPLMGSGDWNDGMNNVGQHGQGESVWLGFFLYRILVDFAPVARARGDANFAELCETEASELQKNLESHGWDGRWYRRAYFDDGTPLGSSQNAECRIDSIAQSWSVLSGAGSDERTRQALDSLTAYLVRPDAKLIQLLDPPFNGDGNDPGYIRGYVPGVRENGGQYTHSAIWAAMAFVEAGRTEQAWQLLDMINPLRHAMTREDVEIYKAEPYVAAADVYAVEPHVGRGGWTWYTGSAGWLYRLIIESLLGIHREGNRLRVEPKLPASWPGFAFTYRFGATKYQVDVRTVPAEEQPPSDVWIELVDDGLEHHIDFIVHRDSTSSMPLV